MFPKRIILRLRAWLFCYGGIRLPEMKLMIAYRLTDITLLQMAAYHAARELEERVRASGGFAQANVSYPAREAAVRAGMGIIGNNGLLITPEFGTRVVIILMATDIENDEQDHINNACGALPALRKMRESCPAGAIVQSGMRFPEKCIRNFMMEGVVAPEHLRAKMGMRLIGCDIWPACMSFAA